MNKWSDDGFNKELGGRVTVEAENTLYVLYMSIVNCKEGGCVSYLLLRSLVGG